MKRLGFKGGESNDVGRIWSMCFENGVSLVDQALEAPASGFLQRFDGSAPPRPLSDVNVEPTFYLNRGEATFAGRETPAALPPDPHQG